MRSASASPGERKSSPDGSYASGQCASASNQRRAWVAEGGDVVITGAAEDAGQQEQVGLFVVDDEDGCVRKVEIHGVRQAGCFSVAARRCHLPTIGDPGRAWRYGPSHLAAMPPFEARSLLRGGGGSPC